MIAFGILLMILAIVAFPLTPMHEQDGVAHIFIFGFCLLIFGICYMHREWLIPFICNTLYNTFTYGL